MIAFKWAPLSVRLVTWRRAHRLTLRFDVVDQLLHNTKIAAKPLGHTNTHTQMALSLALAYRCIAIKLDLTPPSNTETAQTHDTDWTQNADCANGSETKDASAPSS